MDRDRKAPPWIALFGATAGFEGLVAEYERRAKSQPFDAPAAYARQFAVISARDWLRRAAWVEVARRLSNAGETPSSPASARKLTPAALAAGLGFSTLLWGALAGTILLITHQRL